MLGAVAVSAKKLEADSELDQEFLQWASKNNKSYSDSESLKLHKAKFAESKLEVDQLNARQGKKATFALNFTSDMLDDEFAQMLGNIHPEINRDEQVRPLL